MRLLVSGCTDGAAREMKARPDRLGVLMTPRNGNRIDTAAAAGTVWAADNDCFQGLHAARFLRFLAKVVEARSKPLWVAAPDVVADAAATLRQFAAWEPAIHSLGLPVALVGQDGLMPAGVPWDRLEGFFVGGSTEWKLSTDAARLVAEAKARGKLVHAGRVNSLTRIEHFARLNADTFDGSGFSAWGDKRIKLAVRWIDRCVRRRGQPGLFDTGGAA